MVTAVQNSTLPFNKIRSMRSIPLTRFFVFFLLAFYAVGSLTAQTNTVPFQLKQVDVFVYISMVYLLLKVLLIQAEIMMIQKPLIIGITVFMISVLF